MTVGALASRMELARRSSLIYCSRKISCCPAGCLHTTVLGAVGAARGDTAQGSTPVRGSQGAAAGRLALRPWDSADSGSAPVLRTTAGLSADPARAHDLARVVDDAHLSAAFAAHYVAGPCECPLLGLGAHGTASITLSQNVPSSRRVSLDISLACHRNIFSRC